MNVFVLLLRYVYQILNLIIGEKNTIHPLLDNHYIYRSKDFQTFEMTPYIK